MFMCYYAERAIACDDAARPTQAAFCRVTAERTADATLLMNEKQSRMLKKRPPTTKRPERRPLGPLGPLGALPLAARSTGPNGCTPRVDLDSCQ